LGSIQTPLTGSIFDGRPPLLHNEGAWIRQSGADDKMDRQSNIMEWIRRRRSVRNFENIPITREDYRLIEEYMKDSGRLTGPLGTQTRVELVQVTKDVSDKGIKLGTYGIIRNPKAYLIGVLSGRGRRELLDFGYSFESLILFLTGHGIGTCWMGGTFNRNSFEKELTLGTGEWIPCITPAGYPMERKGILESAMRYMVKADKKKEWAELFCDSAFGTALTEQKAEKWAVPIEMIRLGPSASNKQPWRLVVAKDRKAVHFYLQHTPRYSEIMQHIDMGIAMCHFELACRNLGLEGGWAEEEPGLALPNALTEYIISWKC
jgi:nitroreductase